MEEQLGVAAVNWVNRFARRIAPWVLGVAVFLGTLVSPGKPVIVALNGYPYRNNADMVVIVIISIICGVVAGMARRLRWPLFAVAVAGWLLLTAIPTVVVGSYYAAIHLTRRRQATFFLSVAAAVVIVPMFASVASQTSSLLGITSAVLAFALLVALPYTIGLWVNTRRQVLVGLRERAARLELEQALRTDQARTDERARIAREMHDVVAHRVALMVLHAGALEVNAADERLANGAALIRTTGREALTELRQVLGVLRTRHAQDTTLAPQPDLSDLPTLLEQVRAAGLKVAFQQEGATRPLPIVVRRTAYRVIQEALTNVAKHAGGATTVITLRYLSNTIDLKVENEAPQRMRDTLPGSGLGLIGLRERVALLYGRFEARPRLDGGFQVLAVLPADASEVPA